MVGVHVVWSDFHEHRVLLQGNDGGSAQSFSFPLYVNNVIFLFVSQDYLQKRLKIGEKKIVTPTMFSENKIRKSRLLQCWNLRKM